ncbi:MAG: hypothetical protein QW838_05935 [Candidatus Nitrosotenuis sp.]
MLWAVVALTAAARLAWALGHEGYLGVDGGAYLLSRNAVLGAEPTGMGFPRPPLAPGWLLVPFTAWLDDDVGYKVWAVLASLPLIPAAYLLARRFLPPWQALTAATLVAVDMGLAEMLVTGPLPMLGFALIAVGAWAMLGLASAPHWRYALALTGVLPLIAFTNQTSAGLAAVTFTTLYMALAVYHPSMASQPVWRRVLAAPWTLRWTAIAAVPGLLLSMAALPWYLAVVPGAGVLRYPGPLVYLTGWPDIVWFVLVAALVVGVLTAVRARAVDYRLQATGVLVAVLGVLQVFLSYDESIINIFYRATYLLPVFAAPCAVWLTARALPRTPAWRRLAVGATLALVAVLAAGNVSQWQRQAAYSDMVTPATARALATLDDGQGIVTNAFSMGLWVAALRRVPSPHVWTTQPPAAYQAQDAQVRCVLGWVADCDVGQAVQALQVGHVLVDERFPRYNQRAPGNYMAPPDQWRVTARAPWLRLTYSEGTTRLYRIESAYARSAP